MKKRRSLYSCGVLIAVFIVCIVAGSCGKNYYFAGRTLPPSGVLNRVLVAEQNPSAFSTGSLPFLDAYYDIRHAHNAAGGQFEISGYSGHLPLSIQNLPEEQAGAVYNAADGSLSLVGYGAEKVSATVSGGGVSSAEGSPYNGIFISRDLNYVYAANPSAHVITVVNRSGSGGGASVALNVANAYGISVNPGGTVALVFIQNTTQAPNHTVNVDTPNSFAVYSVVQLNATQQAAAVNNPNYLGAQDCQPLKLPTWCVFPVSTGPNASFDHPIKAVFSPDGSTAYVVNCGPECGGTTASLTTIPITASSLNSGSFGASGIALVAQSNIPIPNGATNAVFNGNTLYVAGQKLQSSGLFAGFLTVLNMPAGNIAGSYSIGDGIHNRMVFADDNTLWIGSSQCNAGVRFQQAQAGKNVPYGCITMFDTSKNTATVNAYQGDGTGIAAITGLHKVYTTEGGQIYIYKTPTMAALDNTNVTIAGTAIDVAYMDATSDANNTNY
ncbi:MAG TPA: hypothetical protein VGS02_17900 [Acidobacteriaceae bacterium]|nr:hypothetical protein [Acidobacteriaceae bacterium]